MAMLNNQMVFDVDGWMQWDIVGDMIDASGFERPKMVRRHWKDGESTV